MSAQTINTLIGIVASLLGILTAVATLRARRRRVGLRYGKWTLNLVTNLRFWSFVGGERTVLDGVSVEYNDTPVQRLSATRVLLWNGGTQLIEGAQIAPANPLSIRIREGMKILLVRVLKMSDPGINLIVKQQDESTALINFDYLEPDGGGIIEVVHTGYWSNDLSVEGSIKGCGKLTKPHIQDLSGISRAGMYIAQNPRLARLTCASLLGLCVYFFLFAAREFHIFNYSAYREAMRELHPDQIPLFYAMAFLMTSFIAVLGIGSVWLYLIRKPKGELKDFERKWGRMVS